MTKKFNVDQIFDLATSITNKFESGQSVALKDAFAAGCYLQMIGRKKAGRKICRTVLRTVDFDEDLLLLLAGNEEQAIKSIGAHVEVEDLLKTEAEAYIPD